MLDSVLHFQANNRATSSLLPQLLSESVIKQSAKLKTLRLNFNIDREVQFTSLLANFLPLLHSEGLSEGIIDRFAEIFEGSEVVMQKNIRSRLSLQCRLLWGCALVVMVKSVESHVVDRFETRIKSAVSRWSDISEDEVRGIDDNILSGILNRNNYSLAVFESLPIPSYMRGQNPKRTGMDTTTSINKSSTTTTTNFQRANSKAKLSDSDSFETKCRQLLVSNLRDSDIQGAQVLESLQENQRLGFLKSIPDGDLIIVESEGVPPKLNFLHTDILVTIRRKSQLSYFLVECDGPTHFFRVPTASGSFELFRDGTSMLRSRLYEKNGYMYERVTNVSDAISVCSKITKHYFPRTGMFT